MKTRSLRFFVSSFTALLAVGLLVAFPACTTSLKKHSGKPGPAVKQTHVKPNVRRQNLRADEAAGSAGQGEVVYTPISIVKAASPTLVPPHSLASTQRTVRSAAKAKARAADANFTISTDSPNIIHVDTDFWIYFSHPYTGWHDGVDVKAYLARTYYGGLSGGKWNIVIGPELTADYFNATSGGDYFTGSTTLNIPAAPSANQIHVQMNSSLLEEDFTQVLIFAARKDSTGATVEAGGILLNLLP